MKKTIFKKLVRVRNRMNFEGSILQLASDMGLKIRINLYSEHCYLSKTINFVTYLIYLEGESEDSRNFISSL